MLTSLLKFNWMRFKTRKKHPADCMLCFAIFSDSHDFLCLMYDYIVAYCNITICSEVRPWKGHSQIPVHVWHVVCLCVWLCKNVCLMMKKCNDLEQRCVCYLCDIDYQWFLTETECVFIYTPTLIQPRLSAISYQQEALDSQQPLQPSGAHGNLFGLLAYLHAQSETSLL